MTIKHIGSYQNILRMNNVTLNQIRNGNVEENRHLDLIHSYSAVGCSRIKVFPVLMNCWRALQHRWARSSFSNVGKMHNKWLGIWNWASRNQKVGEVVDVHITVLFITKFRTQVSTMKQRVRQTQNENKK